MEDTAIWIIIHMVTVGCCSVVLTVKWLSKRSRPRWKFVWLTETICSIFMMIRDANCELFDGEEKRKLCKVYSSFKARLVSLISFVRIYTNIIRYKICMYMYIVFLCLIFMHIIYSIYYFITRRSLQETSFSLEKSGYIKGNRTENWN